MLLTPRGKKYALAKEYSYRDVTVPVGFKTDGISYKFRFVGLFLNKFDPRYIEAVVMHDYLTEKGQWEKANLYFEDLLPNTATAKAMVLAVNKYWRLKQLMLGFS